MHRPAPEPRPAPDPATRAQLDASYAQDGERWLESYVDRTATNVAARARAARAATANGHTPGGS